MDNATLCKLVNHAGNIREFLRCFFGICRFEVTNSITGGFPIIFISFTAFSCLTYIFLCCLVISHLVYCLKEGKGKGASLICQISRALNRGYRQGATRLIRSIPLAAKPF